MFRLLLTQFRHSWLNTRFVTGITWPMPLTFYVLWHVRLNSSLPLTFYVLWHVRLDSWLPLTFYVWWHVRLDSSFLIAPNVYFVVGFHFQSNIIIFSDCYFLVLWILVFVAVGYIAAYCCSLYSFCNWIHIEKFTCLRLSFFRKSV